MYFQSTVPPTGNGADDSGPAAVLAAVESVAVSAVARSCGCVVGFGWMVVRFVRVIRVPACARVSRVSRVCPGSPRCLFTGYRGDPARYNKVSLYGRRSHRTYRPPLHAL